MARFTPPLDAIVWPRRRIVRTAPAKGSTASARQLRLAPTPVAAAARALSLACPLAFLALPAASQGDVERPETVERGAGANPCTVDPRADDKDAGARAGKDETLATTLDDCDGVLKPAPQAGKGMVVEPPSEGRTPVIKPKTLPGDPQ
ncbi:hypothetical protein [Breoghania sp. JC706]|uniref:hypothetical protein n=1 Tax=Breoghania sp. JC706 TaxID=3117732 RepID=UPI003009C4D9